MSPLTNEDVREHYPDPIQLGETLRGYVVDVRPTANQFGATQVLDLVDVATGEPRSVWENRETRGLFNVIEPGDLLEISFTRPPAVVKKHPGTASTKTIERRPVYAFTIHQIRKHERPTWADDATMRLAYEMNGTRPVTPTTAAPPPKDEIPPG